MNKGEWEIRKNNIAEVLGLLSKFLKDEPSDEALLKEYEVCQQAINANASRYWTIVGIFIPISTAVLAWVFYTITSYRLFFNSNAEWLVLVLGVVIIVILVLLWFWLKRVNLFISISYFRMREIERKLGMLKNLTVDWVDHPEKAPNEQKARIKKILRCYPPPILRETTSLSWIFFVIGTMWVFFIALAFIFSNC